MVNFTFAGVKSMASLKGLIIEKDNRIYKIFHPEYNRFGESECKNLNECMSEILSFNPEHYKEDLSGRYSEVSCLT